MLGRLLKGCYDRCILELMLFVLFDSLLSEWELSLHLDIWYLEKVICLWIMFMMRCEWVYIYLCTQCIKPLFLLLWVGETHMTINYSWIKYPSNSQWKLEIISGAAIEMDFSQGVTHTWNWAISSYPWNKIAISANAWIEVYETLKSNKRTYVSLDACPTNTVICVSCF